MNSRLTLPCPAKLNLMLHIVGQRENGYHNLQTVFQLLEYGDTLSLELSKTNEIEFECNDPTLSNDTNLIVKTARLLQAESGSRQGARLYLQKRLPAGGGLGGGSSDAATALLGLDALWRLNFDQARLLQLAVSIGADVPVFVAGHSAWAEGIGEQLTPVELAESWYLVINPGIHINTAELFRHPELTRDTPVSTIRSALAGLGHNDFEPLARRLYPELNDAFQALAKFGQFKLSGSGSSLFTQTQSDMTAVQMLEQIQAQYPGYSGFVAKGVNHSPLQRALADEA